MDRKSLFAGMALGGSLVVAGMALGGLAQPAPAPGEPAPIIQAPAEDVTLGVVSAKEIRIVDDKGKVGARLYMHPNDVEGFSMFDMYDGRGELANRIWVDSRHHGYGFFDMIRFQEGQIINRRNELMGRVYSMEDHGEVAMYNTQEKIVARVGATLKGGGVITVNDNGSPLVALMATPFGGQIYTRLKNGRRLLWAQADRNGGFISFYDRETGAMVGRVPAPPAPQEQPDEAKNEDKSKN